MSYMQTRAIPHAVRVKNLFKKAVRAHETRCHSRMDVRYGSVVIRKKFEDKKHLRDVQEINDIIVDTEKQIHMLSLKRKQFDHSPGGIAYGRYVTHPDFILDAWHPMQKAMYPKYFAKREVAKKDYIEWWHRTYGNKTLP